MKNYIPYGKQSIERADIDAVIEVLASDFITQGPAIVNFEQACCERLNAQHAIAVSSATAALHISCLALGLKAGDIVWTTPNTFVASANCARYCGAVIDFIDIDPITYNLDVKLLKLKLEAAALKNALPKIVIPVHFAGQACDMAEISQLAKEYGFYVIEDASHAIGGSYHSAPIGNCRYSDITVFSFHPVKIITTGEGGLILTNNQELHQKLLRLRTHGITRNEALLRENHGPWYYEQLELGFNYRMTDIQAALGQSQLKRLTEFIQKRQLLATRYTEKLQHLPVITPTVLNARQSAWHLYVIMLDLKHMKYDRLKIFNDLRRNHIGVNVHYIPVYKQPYYQAHGFKNYTLPVTENYYERALTLPLYPTLTFTQQDHVINLLEQAFQ